MKLERVTTGSYKHLVKNSLGEGWGKVILPTRVNFSLCNRPLVNGQQIIICSILIKISRM